MPNADPIILAGEVYPDRLDPMLESLRSGLVAAATEATGTALGEFLEGTVHVIAPETTEQGITSKIAEATARSKGLCLLLVAGSGKNPDPTAPGPRMVITLDAQLYVSTRIRGTAARPILELLGALMKFFHQAQIRISGFAWYEELRVLGFDPLADPDFTAYSILIEREFQL